MLGEARSAEQEAAWHSVLQVIADFDRHEKIVISTPMWNFGLPWALKAYVDLLVQPGVSFGLDDSFEHIGLLRDRPVQLIITRSSALPEDSQEDFLLPYLRHILGFIGLRDVRSLVVEGTTLPAETGAEFLAAQAERAREAAARF
ncbi:MAG: NAD(P)H-dependent oxidoreductase [bacterium]